VSEQLLLIDTASGDLLKEVPLPSQFTHDAIRHGDKARALDHARTRRSAKRSQPAQP
jgi:hypothetical protein